MSQKEKHLDFILAVVSRMAQNSFIARGWSITLTTTVLAVAANTQISKVYILSIVPIVVFWLIDANYLLIERRYRLLYDKVRSIPEESIDFSMDVSAEKIKHGLLGAAFSPMLIFTYGSLIALVVLVYLNLG